MVTLGPDPDFLLSRVASHSALGGLRVCVRAGECVQGVYQVGLCVFAYRVYVQGAAVAQASHMGSPRLLGLQQGCPCAAHSSLQLPGAPGPPAPFSKTTSSSAWATAPQGWATSLLFTTCAGLTLPTAPGCPRKCPPGPQPFPSSRLQGPTSLQLLLRRASLSFATKTPQTRGRFPAFPSWAAWGMGVGNLCGKEGRQRKSEAPRDGSSLLPPPASSSLSKQIFQVLLKTVVH